MKKIMGLTVVLLLAFIMVGCSDEETKKEEEPKTTQKEETKTFKEGQITEASVIANTKWELKYALKIDEAKKQQKDDSVAAGSATLELTDTAFTFKDGETTYTGKIDIDAELKACFLVGEGTEFLIQFNAANQLLLSSDGSWTYVFEYTK